MDAKRHTLPDDGADTPCLLGIHIDTSLLSERDVEELQDILVADS